MAWRKLSLLLALSLLPQALAEDKECTGRHGGKYYDLSPLKGKDHKLTTPGGHDVVLSACQSIKQETWGQKLEDPAKVGGFMRGDHGDISLGQTSTQLTFSGGTTPRPQLTLSSGSKCKNAGDLRASTAIEFVCDPSAAQSSPRLVAILPPGDEADACAFFFEWRTTYACPTSEGSTFGGFMWFLFISTLTLLGAYLVIGTLYNFFALGLGGMDALPRFSLAGMPYHAGEALAGLREWFAREGWRDWTSGGGGGRGGGYTRWDSQGGGVPRWDAPSRGDDGGGGGGPGGFVRTRPPPLHQHLSATATNPASHQTQVMQPSAVAPNVGGGGGGINGGGDALGSGGGELRGAAAGLNPASHQAQVMQSSQQQQQPRAPFVSHQTQSAQATQSPAQAALSQFVSAAPQSQASRARAPQTPGEQRAFLLGDDEEDEDSGPGSGSVSGPGSGGAQVADVRGRMEGGGEGPIRL
ncbi:mannose-6-phosphate receptor binding domain-containing protein [Mycena rebaudengoi]|nr:mannose-6-phosphate receptor binding domain-containing protein [Mycena rebaudengoi]